MTGHLLTAGDFRPLGKTVSEFGQQSGVPPARSNLVLPTGDDTMRSILKHTLTWAYCRGWISLAKTQRIFDRLDLGRY